MNRIPARLAAEEVAHLGRLALAVLLEEQFRSVATKVQLLSSNVLLLTYHEF